MTITHEPPVHYAPGDWTLCGAESWTALCTDDPPQVSGCSDCFDLVEGDTDDTNSYRGHCFHCR